MIEENAHLIVSVLGACLVVSMLIAAVTMHVLNDVRKHIRNQHNKMLIDVAMVMIRRLLYKVINNSGNIVKSNMDLFQRRMGAIERDMAKMEGTYEYDVLSLMQKEIESIMSAFQEAWNKQSTDDQDTAKASYVTVETNLNKLIDMFEAFKIVHKYKIIYELLPMNQVTRDELTIYRKNCEIVINELYEAQEEIAGESPANYCGSGDE